jgi:hypothetical protein
LDGQEGVRNSKREEFQEGMNLRFRTEGTGESGKGARPLVSARYLTFEEDAALLQIMP